MSISTCFPKNINLCVIAERMLLWPVKLSFILVRAVLNNTYHDRWTSRGWPTACPPLSLDLNPPDLYLWGHVNSFVCAGPVDNEETLHHRILVACQTICNYPGIFEQMRRSMKRHVGLCIEPHGGHFLYVLFHLQFFFNSNSATGSTRHVGHQFAYCTSPGWLWGWRIWWNDDWQEKPKYSEKTFHSASDRRGGKPAINRLSYGTAYSFSYNSQKKCFRACNVMVFVLILVRELVTKNLSVPFICPLYNAEC
jgi:hypothetical protein